MEVTEAKLFNFNTIVEGYPFNFSIVAPTQAEALGILHRRLTAVLNDINHAENQKKSSNSN